MTFSTSQQGEAQRTGPPGNTPGAATALPSYKGQFHDEGQFHDQGQFHDEVQFRPLPSQCLRFARLLSLLTAGISVLFALSGREPLFALPSSGFALLALTCYRLDPSRYTLSTGPNGFWRLLREPADRAAAPRGLFKIRDRSRWPGLLWLECRRTNPEADREAGAAATVTLLIPADSLDETQWRALRRKLRLGDQPAAGG